MNDHCAGGTIRLMSRRFETQADCDMHFGLCPHCIAACADTVLVWRNVGPDHYLCCDHHNVFWPVGNNEFPTWRYEPPERHEQNSAKIKSMDKVVPVYSRASA